MSLIRNAALLALLAIVPAAAQAQATITACYVPNTGSMYRIKTSGTPTSCKNNHVEFSWESQVTVSYRSGIPSGSPFFAGQTQPFFAYCLEGEVPVGGGFNASGPVQVLYDGPSQDKTGWQATLYNAGSFPITVTARVTCLTVPN